MIHTKILIYSAILFLNTQGNVHSQIQYNGHNISIGLTESEIDINNPLFTDNESKCTKYFSHVDKIAVLLDFVGGLAGIVGNYSIPDFLDHSYIFRVKFDRKYNGGSENLSRCSFEENPTLCIETTNQFCLYLVENGQCTSV